MAGDRFKCAADTIILCFIVAANDPNFALVFHPYLGGTEYMAGGMQGNFYPVANNRCISFNSFGNDIAQPKFQYSEGISMAEVMAATGTGMIAMGVGDHCPRNGQPGIDIKIACRAVKSFCCKVDQRHLSSEHENNMPEMGDQFDNFNVPSSHLRKYSFLFSK